MSSKVKQYDLGDLVVVYTKEKFRDAYSRSALDPTAVFASVLTPSGELSTYEYGESESPLAKDAVGAYHINVDANEAGEWYVRIWSTGVGQAAEEVQFTVREANAI